MAIAALLSDRHLDKKREVLLHLCSEKKLNFEREPTIFISAPFRPSPSCVEYRKVYSVRCEADVVMTTVNFCVACRRSQSTSISRVAIELG